jgi:large subunit ribosomal protein L23
MRSAGTIIKRPLLTEKGVALKDGGGQSTGEKGSAEVNSQVMFEVALDANKQEIRRAVEKLWTVTVVKVRTQTLRGKEKRVGRFVGQRSTRKRAIVTLAKGQTIEFFEGV